MNEKLKRKLEELPDRPGCYMMRDRRGKIIYAGKALSLRKRVRNYFRAGTLRGADPKLRGLINGVEDIDILPAANEAEAILMEGRLIKEYRPRYNTFFKDDKRFLMLRTDLGKKYPRFELCRIRRNDKSLYFGPYSSSKAARCALEFVERHYGIRRCRAVAPGPEDHKHCINDIVRFCSAPCVGAISEADYRARVAQACAFLRGESPSAFKELEEEMNRMREAMNFEKAAELRDALRCLRQTVRQRVLMTRTEPDSRANALEGVKRLGEILGLDRAPRAIEAYDVSNISGTYAVAGMVVAEDGLARPARYRRFRIKTVRSADDPAMMAEVVRRCFEHSLREGGQVPDLLLVDGGAAQVRAARSELVKLGLDRLPVAGLAKRFEQIYREERKKEGWKTTVITLPSDSPALNVLRRLRDEAHRFAHDYHRRLRSRIIRESALDEIPGLGGKRKMLLLKHFGSISRIARADLADIMSVPGVGKKLAQQIKNHMTCLREKKVDGLAREATAKRGLPGISGQCDRDKNEHYRSLLKKGRNRVS